MSDRHQHDMASPVDHSLGAVPVELDDFARATPSCIIFRIRFSPKICLRAVDELGAILWLKLLHLGVLRHCEPVLHDALQDRLLGHHT